MDTINISGNWTGVIIYGKKYREFAGRELFFNAEFTQADKFITEVSIDIHGFGINPDPAEISGFFFLGKISFTKRYKTYSYINGSGKSVFDRSLPGSNIYYTGTYDHDKDMFIGKWEYRITVKFLGVIPVLYKPGGTWSMTRK